MQYTAPDPGDPGFDRAVNECLQSYNFEIDPRRSLLGSDGRYARLVVAMRRCDDPSERRWVEFDAAGCNVTGEGRGFEPEVRIDIPNPRAQHKYAIYAAAAARAILDTPPLPIDEAFAGGPCPCGGAVVWRKRAVGPRARRWRAECDRCGQRGPWHRE